MINSNLSQVKYVKTICIVLVLILSTSIMIVSAKDIIASETIIGDGLGNFGLGDRVDRVYYSDGTVENIIVRKITLPFLSLVDPSYSTINVNYNQPKDITIPIKLKSYCSPQYDNVGRVTVFNDVGTVVGGVGQTYSPCGSNVVVNVVISGSSISSYFTIIGSHTLKIREDYRFYGDWYDDKPYYVTIITSSPVITPTPTPTPTPIIPPDQIILNWITSRLYALILGMIIVILYINRKVKK